MNKERRKKIKEIVKEVEVLQTKLQNLYDEEENYFDNMPENLQGGLRGDDSQVAMESMENALESFGEAISELNDI